MPKSRTRKQARDRQRTARRAQEGRPRDPLAGTVRDILWFDDAANAALLARGWAAFDERACFGDLWDWPPSAVAGDHVTQTYYESSCVSARDGDLIATLAHPTEASRAEATFHSLDDLLADIELIEAYRLGEPVPDMPHAAKMEQLGGRNHV